MSSVEPTGDRHIAKRHNIIGNRGGNRGRSTHREKARSRNLTPPVSIGPPPASGLPTERPPPRPHAPKRDASRRISHGQAPFARGSSPRSRTVRTISAPQSARPFTHLYKTSLQPCKFIAAYERSAAGATTIGQWQT
jgi:hypothetical protein